MDHSDRQGHSDLPEYRQDHLDHSGLSHLSKLMDW